LYYSSNTENFSKIEKILNIIGSPFNSSQYLHPEDYNSVELFNIAQKNKIGLLFLEALAKQNKLAGELQIELGRQRKINETLQVTMLRAAAILNAAKCKYAVIKSIYPFPATPNDVDILVLGNGSEYKNTIALMKYNYFQLIGKEAPLEVCLHDSSRGRHLINTEESAYVKDPLDVDIYNEVGAGHIIYMDKTKLVNRTSETIIKSTKIKILEPTAEIVLSIFHSIYPERLYTLLLHFHILYMIRDMASADVEEFLQVCNENKMSGVASLVLNLTDFVQKKCLDQSPEKLTDLIEALPKFKSQVRVTKLPYLYSVQDTLKAFWSKKADLVFTRSVIRQTLSVLNPQYMSYVVNVHRSRTKRETY
jgi:hypothetical protein